MLGAVALAAWSVAAAAPQTQHEHWQRSGSGHWAEARWSSSTGDARLRLTCDPGEPRVALRLTSASLPADLHRITLVADGTSMDYPLDRAGAGYVARIALDAPILDRMLVARAFTVLAGGRVVQTGVPGDALARVVRGCRELHWPREG